MVGNSRRIGTRLQDEGEGNRNKREEQESG